MGCGGSKSNHELAAIATAAPFPKGHVVLRDLIVALEAEYVHGKEAAVGTWLQRDFEMLGRGGEMELQTVNLTKDQFDAWVENVEDAIRNKATSINNCARVILYPLLPPPAAFACC